MKQKNITLKPTVLEFGPLTQPPKELLQLSPEELESLYLADFQGLYQEECAKQLGVSRPTFVKLLKSGRKKMIEMLMYGKGVSLTPNLQEFILIYPTDDRVTISPHFLVAKRFAFALIRENTIESIRYLYNPIYQTLTEDGIEIINDESAKGMAAGRVIPPLLKEGNLLVVRSLGEGMQRNLAGTGLNIEFTETTDIDKVLESLG
ncbi:MAG TPA: DUF134 domain-containing protein [Epsilonproteobacteria bacterium]|nr:DUF134 domain-containing protein [Campylobacterota bacterium]